MGVGETIVELADAVDHALKPTDPRHRLLIEILRLAPLYRDIRDLSAWEGSFQRALTDQDDHSPLGEMLWEIFELGRFNLYAGFDAPGTKRVYEEVVSTLSRYGVQVSAHQDVSTW